MAGCSQTAKRPPPASNAHLENWVTEPDTLPNPGKDIISRPQSSSAQSANLAIDPFDTGALIERAVTRHRQTQTAAVGPATADGYGTKPIGRQSASSRRGKANRRGRGAAPGPDDAVTLPATLNQADDSACQSPPVKHHRHHGSRQADPSVNCQIAKAAPVGPPDLRIAQRTLARRDDVWQTVRNGLILAGIQHERLTAHLDYLRQRPANVDVLMGRAEPYLQYMIEQIKRQGLPTDLVLVPMVESAFQTTAVSNKQAAGLWQFIPSTGQQYGLALTETYDGRYDTHLATQAALKYLKHLNNLFNGDWLLAFAAYNAGEGAVNRAIQASRLAGGTGSFWELDLPQETQNYVVKILALSKVVADPASLGFKPRKPSPRTTLARVETVPEVHIADLIASSGMAPDEFYKLNPAFKPDVEPPSQPHNFLLPLEKAEILMAANLTGAKVFAPRRVVVKKGETLTVLAKRHGVPEIKLAEWNGLSPKTPLKVGQEILVLGV